jgi:4-amino-4-deoxy-L-arabinose transferase-like glycosyltransferase
MKSGASERRSHQGSGSLLYVASFAAAALVLLPVFRESLNPDGISYLSIAGKYLAGDVRGAVNAYWGPLYSWLLVPLLAAGVAPLLAAHLLGVILGCVAAGAAWRLANSVGLRGITRAAVLGSLLPLLVLTAHQSLSPDLLLTCVLLLYFCLLADEANLARPRAAAAVGVLGGLAYWAKAYGFYFFLAHFAVIAVADVVRSQGDARRRALAFYGLAFAVFAVLSSLWVGALAWKYGQPMLASTGAYNRVLAAPGSRGHPTLYQGFLPPPDATAVSAWEDPTRFDLGAMRASARIATPSERVAVVAHNLRRTASFLAHFAGVPCLIIAAWVVRRSWRRAPGVAWRPLAVLLAAAAIYPLGYIPILVTVRSLLILPILLAVAAAALLPGLGARRWLPVLTAALALGVAVVPAQELVLATRPVMGASSQQTAATLAPFIARDQVIASNGEWEQSLYVAYRLGCRYFGQRGDLAPTAVPGELARWHVGYYLAWDETPEEAAALRGLAEVSGGTVPGLKVYAVSATTAGGGPPPPVGGR